MKERDEYDWSDAAKDIALLTNLTIGEATAVTAELRDLLHPYDSVLSLVALFESVSPVRAARALAQLLRIEG